MAEVFNSYFNETFSLIWDYHNNFWVLTYYEENGDEKGFEIGHDDLKELVDLMHKVNQYA